MAYFQRIALIFFLSIPAFTPNTAFADYPKVLSRYFLNGWNYSDVNNNAVCMYFVNAKRSAYPNENIVLTNCSEVGVNAQGWSGGAQYYSNPITKYGKCNGVESLWGTGVCSGAPPTCTAPLVYQSSTGSCVDPCAAKQGKYGPTVLNVSKTSTMCYQSCLLNKTEYGDYVPDCQFDAVQNKIICKVAKYANTIYTGTSCTANDSGAPPAIPPAETPPEPSPEPDCPQCTCGESGGAWGSVGGINTCVPQGSPNSTPVETTPPPVTTSTTPPPTPENPNPTPVVTTEQPPVIVVASGGAAGSSPTITETKTNADGSTTTTTKSKDQFCADTPDASLCKGDGTGSKNSFNGNCDPDGTAQVICDGDAIQCAIAKQSAEMNCKSQLDAPAIGVYNAMKAEGNSKSPMLSANQTHVDIPSELDDSTPFGAQCPEDMFFTVFGRQITLPISRWCPYLAWVGNVFLALAYLYGARSLVGSL